MSARLLIRSAGALATIQDRGRPGWRRCGVPCAGVLDVAWMRLANALVGNAEGQALIEFFIAGPTLQALDGPVRLACAGDMPLTLQRGGERQRLDCWRSITLHPGDELHVGAPRRGRVGCVAVAGLQLAPVLGSASTYARAGLGGVAGRALVAGDCLNVAAADGARPERVLRTPPHDADAPIRIVPGPQDDHFDAAALTVLLASAYRVSRDADRMGLRLEGPALQHRADKGADIVSDAVLPGSIQVPGNGQPIVLLADGQTMGGYPKIATVVSADLGRLARAAVGTALRFQALSVAEAETLARQRDAEIRARIAAIEALILVDGVDLDALAHHNLISAMIDALDPPNA